MSSSQWQRDNYLYLTQNVNLVVQYLNNFLPQSPELNLTDSSPSIPLDDSFTLEKVGTIFGLSDFERIVLLLCVADELIPNFRHLCAQIHDDAKMTYPTYGLALEVFGKKNDPTVWAATNENSPLQKWQLIIRNNQQRITTSPLRVDPFIFHYLIGASLSVEQNIDSALKPLLIFPTPADGNNLPDSHKTLVRETKALLNQDAQNRLIPNLIGTDTNAISNIASLACQLLDSRLVNLRLSALPDLYNSQYQLAIRLERFARLHHCIYALSCHQTTKLDSRQVQVMAELVTTPLLIVSEERLELDILSSVVIDVSPPTTTEQFSIWNQSLEKYNLGKFNGYVHQLTASFNLSQQRIESVIAQTKATLGDSQDQTKIKQSLWHYCRIGGRTNLEGLARRIDARATWDNLILPEQTKQQLKNIISQVAYQGRVYQEWGFANASSRGLGITALFAGVSGTGKTTAAEVIARELNLDLYCIDLSAIVSKYIGETEKNLRRIFDTAESAGAILLFDEADALFGKRTEATDAKDKYANMEVSYLLQKMEAYRGLAILTTNIKDALDSAFKRRLRFIVDFAFPDVSARTKIWRSVFPTSTPTRGLDFEILAQLNLTGGNIRSIALNAAFEAAKNSEPVMMKHIAIAAEKESLKLGLDNWSLKKVFQQALRSNQEHTTQGSELSTKTSSSEKELSLEQLIKLAEQKFQQQDYAAAYQLASHAYAQNPDDSTANYWLGWTGYHYKRPHQEVLSAFNQAEHGNQDWWRVGEGRAATWYWQGKILSLMKEEPQTVIDFYQRYLAAFPRGYFAADAMQGLQDAKMEMLFGQPPE